MTCVFVCETTCVVSIKYRSTMFLVFLLIIKGLDGIHYTFNFIICLTNAALLHRSTPISSESLVTLHYAKSMFWIFTLLSHK